MSHNSTTNVTSGVIRDPGLCGSFADRCSRYSSCEDCTTAGCFYRRKSCSLERDNYSISSKCVVNVHGSLAMCGECAWIIGYVW